MTVVDSSVLVAIVLNQPQRDELLRAMSHQTTLLMSAVNVYEASVVAFGRERGAGVRKIQELIDSMGIQVLPFDAEQASQAIQAYQTYGKGVHPAGFNLGDCPAYALAKLTNSSLLFIGNDFSRTDVVAAI